MFVLPTKQLIVYDIPKMLIVLIECQKKTVTLNSLTLNM